MTETTKFERDSWRREASDPDTEFTSEGRQEIAKLVNDADRLTAIEREVRELAELWDQQQSEYPNTQEGEVAAAAVRCCARELRAILDPEGD